MGEGWVFSSTSSRLHPHLHVLRDLGVSVERELEHDGLPPSFEERPDIRTATRLIGKFVARMEHKEGIDDLCVDFRREPTR